MPDMYSIKQDSMSLTNVYRALVTYSSSATGEIRVKIPALLGPDTEVTLSTWGRSALNGTWIVPAVSEQIVVASDDSNLTNLFWLIADPTPEIPTGFVTNTMLAGGITANKLASYPNLVIPHTFTIGGAVMVAVGQVDYIPPFFVKSPSTQKVKLVSARHRINSGTSATVKVQINGVDAPGFTGMSVTTTATDTDPADITLANNDLVSLVVTAVSGSPLNMSVTLFFEYTWVG